MVSLLRVVSACAVSPACLQYADLSAIGSARSAPPRGSHVKNYFCGPRLSLAALRTGPLSLWLLYSLCCYLVCTMSGLGRWHILSLHYGNTYLYSDFEGRARCVRMQLKRSVH